MKNKRIIAVAGVALTAASSAWSASYDVSGQNVAVDLNYSSMAEVSYTPAETPFSGIWSFVFHDNGTADFDGNLFLGDYSAFTELDAAFLGEMSGTVSYQDANHLVSGTGVWDAQSHTLSYLLGPGGANSSIGSSYSESGSSCSGNGSIGGVTLCDIWAETTPEWEGLALELVFADDLGSFSGSIIATERSGVGFTAHSSVVEYAINGNAAVSEVPIPAAAWLFGSGLMGLAAAARRRTRH